MKIPDILSPGWLKIDPTFDPLRLARNAKPSEGFAVLVEAKLVAPWRYFF